MMSTKERWSCEERTILQDGWITMSMPALVQLLPRRTPRSIKVQANRLGIRGRAIRPLPPPLDRIPEVTMNDIQRSQLAMMIDCEGTLGMRHGKRLAPYIQVTNTDERLIEKFKALTGTRSKTGRFRHKNKHWKEKLSIEVATMPRIYCVLQNIMPYLLLKKQQGFLLMEFIEIQDKRTREIFDRAKLTYYSDRQTDIAYEIAQLNKKGETI